MIITQKEILTSVNENECQNVAETLRKQGIDASVRPARRSVLMSLIFSAAFSTKWSVTVPSIQLKQAESILKRT